MAPVILTCPVAAMGATGKVTDPGMSEAISGCQRKQEGLLMTEKPNNKQGNCHTSSQGPAFLGEVLDTLLTASHLTGPVLGSVASVFHLCSSTL